MAYITKEQVAKRRELIKSKFPASKGWKFSIVNENGSTISVSIIESPIDFTEQLDGRSYMQVNVYYIKEHFTGEAKDVLLAIRDICNEGNFDKSDISTDYHHVGWYTSINIGKWDKPFKVSDKVKQTPKQKERPTREQIREAIKFVNRPIEEVRDEKINMILDLI